ncbi:MAG: sugar phosphate isomerase/epimerase family protein [Vicinamibacterales bacterium]
MRFGISTHLFHGERLERAHIERIQARGFDLVEIFATRSHLDYHDPQRVADLHRWLDELHVSAWSLHAPISESFIKGTWGRAFSNASPDGTAREDAVHETRAAIRAAGDLGCAQVVLHLGIPDAQNVPPRDNDPGAARRSLEPIAEACAAAGVQLALELIPNSLATADGLLQWLEGDLDLGPAGACLDTGHAHLTGGAPEAAELLSGYISTTHIHDNRGKADDHLMPFDGTIDWPATLMTLSKVGYTGPYMFELPDHGDAERTLARATTARQKIQAILDDLARPFTFGEDG